NQLQCFGKADLKKNGEKIISENHYIEGFFVCHKSQKILIYGKSIELDNPKLMNDSNIRKFRKVNKNI
ncbi:hypothetical protein BpHYR1_031651, partial [Brachionus plicatilis]